jgi:ankyrin repeat protein
MFKKGKETGKRILKPIRLAFILLLVQLIPLNVSAEDVNDHLLNAAFKGHSQTVKDLLADGADPNAEDDIGQSALIGAARNGHEDTVSVLLAAGANVNLRLRGSGWTALTLSAKNGHPGIVKALLENGAELSIKDKYGRTALMWAAENGHSKVVKALLSKGADLHERDSKGKSALALAKMKKRRHTVKVLEEAGAREGEIGMTPEMVEAALGKPDAVSHEGDEEIWGYEVIIDDFADIRRQLVYFVHFKNGQVVRTTGDKDKLRYLTHRKSK